MAPDVALLLRSASAILLLTLGVGIAWKGRTRGANVALGTLLVLWGSGHLLANLSIDDFGKPGESAPFTFPGAAALYAFLALLWPVPTAVLLYLWAREDGPAARGRLALALAPTAGILLWAVVDLAQGVGVPWRAPYDPIFDALGIPFAARDALASYVALTIDNCSLAIALYATTRAAAGRDPARHGAIALGLGIYATYVSFTYLRFPQARAFDDAMGVAMVALPTVLLTGGWLLAAARGLGRPAVLVALAFPSAALLGLATPLLTGATHVEDDLVGMRGIVRTVAWTCLLVGVLRHDLLGVELKTRSVDRASLAAGALAVLFVVAQVAQNFFSASYGLLTGGIVAGAFLFAAQPLQRAAERLVSGRVDPVDPAAPASSRAPALALSAQAGNEEALRAAMRLAWRDRRFDHAEEAALADLAERLGIGARRATEIRHEVERERGVA